MMLKEGADKGLKIKYGETALGRKGSLQVTPQEGQRLHDDLTRDSRTLACRCNEVFVGLVE